MSVQKNRQYMTAKKLMSLAEDTLKLANGRDPMNKDLLNQITHTVRGKMSNIIGTSGISFRLIHSTTIHFKIDTILAKKKISNKQKLRDISSVLVEHAASIYRDKNKKTT